MAFGDIVNTEKVSVASGDVTITISPTATLGNLLVIVEGRSAAHGAGGAWGTPSGWNILHSTPINSGNVAGAAYWKISDGTETSAVTGHTTPNGNAQAVYAEFEGAFDGSPLDVQAEDEGNLTTVVKSQSTGTTGATAQADELIVAMFNADQFQTIDTGRAYTNSFVERVIGDASAARATAIIASKVVSATGTQECTFSCDAGETGDEMYGQIATFKKLAAGGDPEGSLLGGKLLHGGLLLDGVLVRN